MPGNIGRAVGVYTDHAKVAIELIQQKTPVADLRCQAGHGGCVHVKEFRAYRHNLWIKLYTNYRDITVNFDVLPRNGASSQADQEQRSHFIGAKGGLVEIRRRQKIVPSAAVKDFSSMPLAVDALPFVQIQVTITGLVFLHLDIVVGALAVVAQASVRCRLSQWAIKRGQRQNSDNDRHGKVYQSPLALYAQQREESNREKETRKQ